MSLQDRLSAVANSPGRLPVDLAAAVVVTLLANGAIFLPVVRETPVRAVLGVVFLLFVPGYVAVAALFPESGTPLAGRLVDTSDRRREDSGNERLVLSVGLSVPAVSVVAYVLHFTPWGIRLTPLMVALSLFTVIVAAVAGYRRARVPVDERFHVPVRSWYETRKATLVAPGSRRRVLMNAVVIASVLLVAVSVGYAVTVPPQDDDFTEFYLLTENETGGLVAAEYPTELPAGERRELVVGVANHEYERVNYTVVVELQRVAVTDNETRVSEREELHRFSPTIGHNETWQRRHTVSPVLSGDRLRLQYLLYRGSAPESPNRSSADQEVHLWINGTS